MSQYWSRYDVHTTFFLLPLINFWYFWWDMPATSNNLQRYYNWIFLTQKILNKDKKSLLSRPKNDPIWSENVSNIHFLQRFFFNCDSLHPRLNSHYKTWSSNKKKHKKIKTCRKIVQKEPTDERSLLILDLNPLR